LRKKLLIILLAFILLISVLPICTAAYQGQEDYDSGYEEGYEDGARDAKLEFSQKRDNAKRETEESFWNSFNEIVWFGVIAYGVYLLWQFGKIVIEIILEKRSRQSNE